MSGKLHPRNITLIASVLLLLAAAAISYIKLVASRDSSDLPQNTIVTSATPAPIPTEWKGIPLPAQIHIDSFGVITVVDKTGIIHLQLDIERVSNNTSGASLGADNKIVFDQPALPLSECRSANPTWPTQLELEIKSGGRYIGCIL
jgi:hypothetical protein